MICDDVIKQYRLREILAKKSRYVVMITDKFDNKHFCYCGDLAMVHDELEQLYKNRIKGERFLVIDYHGKEFVPEITGFKLKPI